ncbi:MAG: hypothetical protein Q8916_11275 [Bacteroidota bacterium]|nr:hypothetical protein [Bacteroidota bacterium]MDP4230972.1 hypothetical protein [Bacteroidota bacterium]
MLRRITLAPIVFISLIFVQSAQGMQVSVVDSSGRSDRAADSSATKKLFWVSAGGGVISSFLGADLKATYAWGSSSISAKACAATELSIFGSPDNEMEEYGIYYGMQSYNDWGLIRVAAGPSYYHGLRNGYENIHNFGAGLEAEAMLKFKYIGLSLMATVMLNPQFIYAGFLLNFSVGILN